MTSEKLVIGVTGMAGSGKSLVVGAASHEGYEVIVMGDEVRQEAAKRGLEPTPENLGKVMLDLRQLHGVTVIAKRCIAKVESTSASKILIDGIRSLDEAEEFKKHYPDFFLIAVHSSPETRFNRLYKRQRSDDPKDWQVFRQRDLRELSVGLGNAIAMSQHIIINEDNLGVAKEKARMILRKAEAKWMK